jgi:hypothetical protein
VEEGGDSNPNPNPKAPGSLRRGPQAATVKSQAATPQQAPIATPPSQTAARKIVPPPSRHSEGTLFVLMVLVYCTLHLQAVTRYPSRLLYTVLTGRHAQ